MWSRGAFYRFLASLGRGLETILLAEVRQHDTILVRHLSSIVPLSAPTLLRSACTNREQQALLHVGLSEETATVVEVVLVSLEHVEERMFHVPRSDISGSELHLATKEPWACFAPPFCFQSEAVSSEFSADFGLRARIDLRTRIVLLRS